MSILRTSLLMPAYPQQPLSSAKALSVSVSLTTRKLSHFSLTAPISIPYRTTPIRMGGGPRTYPGGVSKWQWKRMQAQKGKQLLKARLARERQIYEMRKRAELKAAVSELERPWETVERPPNLFSVGADEQLKVLADRFQKPGGFDLWSEKDGPELFRTDNGLPSSRFFPKGVVHSVKPYGKVGRLSDTSGELEGLGLPEDTGNGSIRGNEGKMSARRSAYHGDSRSSRSDQAEGRNSIDLGAKSLKGVAKESESVNFGNGRFRKKGNRRKYSSDSEVVDSRNARFPSRNDGRNHIRGDSAGEFRRTKSYEKGGKRNSRMFDASLQNDGSYGFELEK